MAAINFDSNTVEPAGSFEPLPLGEYTVIISSTEIKPTSKDKDKPESEQKNKYLLLTYDVIDGQYKGRVLFDRLNIKNETDKAQEIAQRSLSAICRCVGIIHPTDTDQLKGIPFIIKVGIRKGDEKFGPTNDIKEYKRCDGVKLSEVTDAVAPSSKVEPTKAKRPWEKKA
jgi:hypothetical protein